MSTDAEESNGPTSRRPFQRVLERLRPSARARRGALRRLGETFFATAVSALICVTAGAAVFHVVSNGWNADAAAWTQAFGTILAVAGAAWLARGEVRRARQWRREQGEEAAWGVRFVLSQAQFDAQIVAAELANRQESFEIFDVRSWKQRSDNSSLAIQTMLSRTDYVHPAVVFTLCNAKILVDQLSADLITMEELMKRGEEVDDQIVSDIVYAHINLATLIDQYDARVRGIRQALDRGSDMLPLHELAGWDRNAKESADPASANASAGLQPKP